MDKHSARRALAMAAGALAASGGLMAVASTSSAGAPDKVTICHGTASDTHPYVQLTVSVASFKDGHFDGGPPNPSHGDENHPDFVLQPGSTCDDGPGGATTTTSQPPT